MYFLLKKLNKPIFNYKIDFNRYINVFELKSQKVYQKDKLIFILRRSASHILLECLGEFGRGSVTHHFGNFRN